MTEEYDPFPDLARLLDAALRAGRDGAAYAERIAGRLGVDPGAGPEAAEKVLREALGVPGPRVPGDDQPLTCARCRHAPASRLLVAHWRTETIRLLCGGCAEADAEQARDLPSFRMVTVLAIGPEAAARAATTPLAPPPPGGPAVSAYLARRATCRRCGEPGLVPCPAVLGLWLSDRQGTGRGLCPDGEMHQAENITEGSGDTEGPLNREDITRREG
jgi:hypothetical protein